MRKEKNQEFLDRISKMVKAYKTEPAGREVEGTVELLEELTVYLKEEGQTLKINTPTGDEIVAEMATDINFPGIYLFYNKKDEEYTDRNTALLEWNDIKKQLRLCVWGDEDSEDFTHEFVLSSEPKED